MNGSAEGKEPSDISPEAIVALLGPWQREVLKQLARQVVHRLSRLPAAGLFSEYSYKSVWGEYCHHVQNGHYETFSNLLNDMMDDA